MLRGFNTQTTPRSQAQGQAPNLSRETTRIHPTRMISPRAEQHLCEYKLETSVPGIALQAQHTFPLLCCQKSLELLSVPLQSPAHLQRGIQPRAVLQPSEGPLHNHGTDLPSTAVGRHLGRNREHCFNYQNHSHFYLLTCRHIVSF